MISIVVLRAEDVLERRASAAPPCLQLLEREARAWRAGRCGTPPWWLEGTRRFGKEVVHRVSGALAAMTSSTRPDRPTFLCLDGPPVRTCREIGVTMPVAMGVQSFLLDVLSLGCDLARRRWWDWPRWLCVCHHAGGKGGCQDLPTTALILECKWFVCVTSCGALPGRRSRALESALSAG